MYKERIFAAILAPIFVLALAVVATYQPHEQETDADTAWIDWTDYEQYLPYVREKLKANPDLTHIDGHDISISSHRTLILDGNDTRLSIDLPRGYWREPDSSLDTIWFYEADSSYQVWETKNFVYEVPSGYTGELYTYEATYRDENGERKIQYQVPHLSYEEVKDNINSYSVVASEVDKNGQTINYYAPYHIESTYFMERSRYGEVIESHYLDGGDFLKYINLEMFDFPNILGKKGDAFIINIGSTICSYDISKDALKILYEDCE